MENSTYPYEIKDVDPETNTMLMNFFAGERGGFIRAGSKGYILTQRFKELATDIYNMQVRPSDVYVVTYARSGTTWTQELVWLVGNDLDYETAKTVILPERFPFIEHAMLVHPSLKAELLEKNKNDESKVKIIDLFSDPITERLAAAPSPRFIKSHLPLSLLPPNILDGKVVYVARDPRDVAVSFFLMCREIKMAAFQGDFKSYWDLFTKDLIYWTPFFEHLKEAWEKRNDPNMLFLFYEELKKDLSSVVRRVAKFLGKDYNEKQIADLCDHLDIKNFRNNNSVNNHYLKDIGFVFTELEFIRKGKTGGWRDYFDVEMTAQAQKWIDDNLKDTDLRFPTV